LLIATNKVEYNSLPTLIRRLDLSLDIFYRTLKT